MNGFWNLKTDLEIIDTLRVNELIFIGKFKKIYDTLSLFSNLRNVDYSPVLNLKSNVDERNFVKCEILNRSNFPLIENVYYKISAKIISQKKRISHKNEFLLEFDNDCNYEVYIPNEKDFTYSIYDNHIRSNNANNIGVLKAVKTITYQINKKNETFIYELLQNADDYPSENEKVEVDFFITDKYLLFTHSGSKFNFNNVYSLCAVNAEDKTDDFDKIGFKGIGFKSVFKANDYVYLNSGAYSFRFEKSYHNAEYPWQLMPIWTEINDLEISLKNNSRFLKSNVGIALRPRDTFKTLNEYSNTLELFSDDRILLFLKNIDKVNVFIDKEKKIFCKKNKSKWWLRHFEIEISEKITEFLNAQINEGNEEIPSKYSNLKKCKISFAAEIIDNKINKLSDAKLFNYLPLSINLNIPFLINADFIPDGEREGLINNEWNQFLLETSGYKFVHFIKDTLNYKKKVESFKYSIFNLIPSFKTNADSLKNNEKWHNYFNSFKLGFETAITGNEAIAFIPVQSGNLESLSNVLIDETGLANLLEQDFLNLTGINQNLIDHKIELDGITKLKTLILDYNVGKIYSISELKADLKKPAFQEWLKIPENNFKIIQHFNANKNLQELLETEAIILTANNELRIGSEVYNSVPDVVTFITFEKVNDKLFNLLNINNITLKLKTFNPVAFYSENILGKQNSINQQLSNELDLLNFWRFVYDYWNDFEKEDKIKASLKLFVVLCKTLEEESLDKNLISTVYIARDFNLENEIESIITEIGIQDAKFISEKYISKDRIASKWNQIFKQAYAIIDLQKVIEILLPQLSTIEESKHFEIAKQIFKYWKENQNKGSQLSEIQLNLLQKTLKIKAIDDNYYIFNQLVISDHYNNNNIIKSILPLIELSNQVSSEYGPKINQIADWKTFFGLIQCVSLAERQNVLDAKIAFLIKNQEIFKENHFEIIKSISDLFKARSENGLKFPESLSQIKLFTDCEQWLLPTYIHLSSIYKPKLDLQNDDEVNNDVFFLNEKYIPNEIDKYFLTSLGIHDNFRIYKTELKRDEIPANYLEVFEKKDSYIKSNAISWASQHRLANHITTNYPELLKSLKYSMLFWEELIKPNSIFLNQIFEISNYKMAFNKIVNNENYLIYYLKTHETIPNQNGKLKKPNDLYSYSLANYVTNKAELLKYDFSKIYLNNNSKSLEDILDIKSELSQEYCISILSRIENEISIEEICNLEVVRILTDYIPSELEKENIRLLNQNLDWKPLNELIFYSEEEFVIEDSKKLHHEFIPIAINFKIKELSNENLILKTIPEKHERNNDIALYFENKAKFIAFKINPANYLETEKQIIDKIQQYNFYEVSSLVKVFPENDPIYISEEYQFYNDNNTVIYQDNWKTNNIVIDFLFTLISSDRIERKWFENLINRWDDRKVIEKLNEDIGNTPLEWNNNQMDFIEIAKSDFLKEVENFIESMKEVEDIYDADKIEDLKSILAEFKNHPKEKQMTFNLLAKLKLCKKIHLEFDRNWEYNSIESGIHKYLIHSARGSFAYVHPNEILKMKNEGYKMAIDYGTKDIRIYNSHSEIISLYQNYLMLYQGSKSEADILSICENSASKDKFHFLIADREKQVGEGLAIFKFLNNESYD